MSNVRRGFSVGASSSLTTSYPAAGVALTEVTGTDSKSKALPDECFLAYLRGSVNTIAGGAAKITWWLATDSGGDEPLTEEVQETIKTGQTTATKGSIRSLLDSDYTLDGTGTAGKLYLFAKTDAGTCNLVPRLHWRNDL